MIGVVCETNKVGASSNGTFFLQINKKKKITKHQIISMGQYNKIIMNFPLNSL